MRKWSNWEELMVFAQKGNAKMYNQLLSEVTAYLTPYLKFKVGSETIASEIAQEVLISVHNSRHTYNAQFPFKPWLFKIVQSRLVDFFRKNKMKYELLQTIDGSFIETFSAESQISLLEVNELKKALNTLNDDQREIIIALKINGQSIKEIADSKKMSESAVKTTAHRAYKSLSITLGVDL